MKRIFTLLLLSVFILSSCNAFVKTPQYVSDIVGEWKLCRTELEYVGWNQVEKLVEIKAFFNEDYTGSFIREETEKSWLFTWSYDEKAGRYLIYRENDTYVRFACISKESNENVMIFENFEGTKID